MPTFVITKGSLAGVALAVAGAFGASKLIAVNAAETVSSANSPLPVAVTDYLPESSYQRSAQFHGSVRAAHHSAAGFEVAGTIISMPVNDGSVVAAGDVLAVLDTERRVTMRKAMAAQHERLSNELQLAQLRLQRVSDLHSRQLVADQDFDEARLNVEALKASKDATAAQLEQAEIEIAMSTLRAPFAAVVGQRMAQVGAVVNAGTPVMQLVASGQREAHIGLPIQFTQRLVLGEMYTLQLGAYEFDTTLESLRADADSTTLTVTAVFNLPSEVRATAGQSITLKLDETVASRGGWLPLTALVEGDRGLWNVLVVADSEPGRLVARREAVEVIYSDNDRVFVRGTLPAGAKVIAAGVHRLTAGSDVRVAESESQP